MSKYTEEEIKSGKVSIGDMGSLYGYVYQVVRWYKTFTENDSCTEYEMPCFDTENEAVTWLVNQYPNFKGCVQRYTKDHKGKKSWVTAGTIRIDYNTLDNKEV